MNTTARQDPQTLQQSIVPGSVIVASTGRGPFEQVLLDGRHNLHGDEPVAVGGGDAGPSPYELWCSIQLIGTLDEAQRNRLIEIAKQCPVHRTLTNKIEIRTDLVGL